MGIESDQSRLIAERIARRLSQGLPPPSLEHVEQSDLTSELAAMRASLGELQRRLGQIETKVRSGNSGARVSPSVPKAPATLQTHSPWLQGVNAPLLHPSQEQFGVEEATVTQLVDFFQSENKCAMEPGGKPCDHCAMCSSRGF